MTKNDFIMMLAEVIEEYENNRVDHDYGFIDFKQWIKLREWELTH